jgi:hypothetical protein
VKSRELYSRLAEAVEYATSTGAEAGFVYCCELPTQQTYLTHTIYGTQEAMPSYSEWARQLGLNPDARRAFLFDLHLHGGSGGTLDLSPEDIAGVDQRSISPYVRPIVAVGKADGTGLVHLLILQKEVSANLQDACPSVLEQAFQQYLDVEELWPSKEVARHTCVPRFLKTGMITYALVGPTLARPHDLADLSRFR